jgi:nucleotide-binding universal stress UspA family protein
MDFFDESWRLTLNSRLRERMQQLQNKTGIEADIVVESGDPHKVVAAAANRLGADLVVIGRSLSGTLIGRLHAHAYEIIRLSPCPVVSL